MSNEEQAARPRFGKLTRADGTDVPLVFHPGDEPGEFVALAAADETPVVVGPGDQMMVDVIGPGQSVIYEGEAP